MDNQEALAKAEEHWEFLEKWLHMAFVDAFAHGWKHGEEEAYDKTQQP
jgi:flagellar biosynthesis/type III secretory pathway protein FliH